MSVTQPLINLDPTLDSSQQAAFINQNFQAVQNSLNPMIISDGTNNRIILGKQVDGTYGMKVSQSGVDVGTAINSQLIFNSSQDVFKIASKQTISMSINHTNGAADYKKVTAAHGLSSTPAYLAFINIDPAITSFLGVGSGSQANPSMIIAIIGGSTLTPAYTGQVSVDGTNIIFEVNMIQGFGTATYNFSATVYLLQETFS